MNALGLKFNATSFKQRAQIIKAVNLDFRSTDQINIFLGDKVSKSENTAGKLYETNPEKLKRKSNDTLNIEFKKYKYSYFCWPVRKIDQPSSCRMF